MRSDRPRSVRRRVIRYANQVTKSTQRLNKRFNEGRDRKPCHLFVEKFRQLKISQFTAQVLA